jgi:hypothetical protein
MEKVNLGEKLARFADHWSPKVVGEQVKFAGASVAAPARLRR